jgi:hypothetical protein
MRNIIQFAIVTPNTDETLKLICETLNLGPLKVWDFNYPAIFDTTINESPNPWTMKLAFGSRKSFLSKYEKTVCRNEYSHCK